MGFMCQLFAHSDQILIKIYLSPLSDGMVVPQSLAYADAFQVL